MTTTTKIRWDRIPESFDELNRWHPLRPIRAEVDLDNSQEVVDHLAVLDRRNTDQEDYLESLSTLIEKYEEEHHAIDTSDLDPIDTLKSLMEERGMNASDLGRVLGNRTLGSLILNRRRQLSKAHILVLSKHFKVGPAAFLKG
jgi:HTH-type transcriptional regulator / antitoxin HigA